MIDQQEPEISLDQYFLPVLPQSYMVFSMLIAMCGRRGGGTLFSKLIGQCDSLSHQVVWVSFGHLEYF